VPRPTHIPLHPLLPPPTLYLLDNKVKDAGIDLYFTAGITLGDAALKEYFHFFILWFGPSWCSAKVPFAEYFASSDEKKEGHYAHSM